MDHNEALRLQAVEKYVLGELPGALRKEFEEHFFDCTECAHDLKTATLFADNAREVFEQEAAKDGGKRSVPLTSGWLGWLRPMVAAPALAVLLLALAYQSLVSVPHWKNVARQAASPRVLPMYSLIRARCDWKSRTGRPRSCGRYRIPKRRDRWWWKSRRALPRVHTRSWCWD